MDLFEELDSKSSHGRNDKPLWKIDYKDIKPKSEAHKWLMAELSHLKKINEDRIQEQRRHRQMYKGVQYFSQEVRRGQKESEETAKWNPKVVINHLYDYTEQRTARFVKYKPAIYVGPTNDQQQDKVASKTGKSVLDTIEYNENYDAKFQKSCRVTEIEGEAYFFILWDKNKGKMHPEYNADMGPMEMIDDDGNPMTDDMGMPMTISSPVRIGDVSYEVELSSNVLLQQKDKFEDVDYCFRVTRKNVEELKSDYPHCADDINYDPRETNFNSENVTEDMMIGETYVFEFYHRSTKHLEGGWKVKFTKDCILEGDELGPEYVIGGNGELPLERLAGIEVPGELYGKSFFINVKGITSHINNVTNMIIRNQVLYSHPKWFTPRGTVKLESLTNGTTIVQYQGSQPPILAQSNPTPAEMFNFRNQLKDDANQQAAVFGVSRGDPPPGITASVSLKFLKEQENERYSAEIAKIRNFAVRVARKSLSVAGEKYQDDDKRMALIMGVNNQWQAEHYDVKHLRSEFDIRVLESNDIQDSPAQITQDILDLGKVFPTLYSKEEIADMLNFPQRDKYLSEASAAINSAQYENEQIFDGKDIPEPAPYEIHSQHWVTHLKAMQDPSFKRAPPEIKKQLEDHLKATEYLMLEQAKKNPAYDQIIMTLPQFPVLFNPLPPPIPPAPMPMEASGAPPMPNQPMPNEMGPEAVLPPEPMENQPV